MKGIKKSVVELPEYSVVQDTSVVKLNQNESPYAIPAALKKEIVGKLNEIEWNRYPCLKTCQLVDAISDYTDYPASGIVAGNGSNEIIQAVLLSICKAGDKIILVSPGFSIYAHVAKIMGLIITEVPLLDDFRFDVSSIIERSSGARIVIIASPNNPTGTTLSIEELKKIAENIEGMLAVDEAYFEFYKKTAQNLLEEFENIIIMRTFSKAFGLAGIRLGYLLAKPELTKEIQKAKLPFSVGVFQQIAGDIVMRNKEFLEDVVAKIIEQREVVFSQLNQIPGIKPIPSCTNFILFELKKKSAKDVFNTLYKHGVLLRYFENPKLRNMLRVTIGTPRENRLFLERLKEILGGKVCR